MRVPGLGTLLLGLVVLSLIAPVAAAQEDEVWGAEGIVISPHDGPNGGYATLDGDGSVAVDLGDDLNPRAVTTFDGVFDLSNAGTHRVRVWVTHDSTEYVEVRADGSGSIQDEENGTVLSPGETVVVDLAVDTRGASPGQDLIDEIQIHARRVGVPEPTRDETIREYEPTIEPITVYGTVRVEFDREVSDESLRVEHEDQLPPGSPSFGIRPVVRQLAPGESIADPREPQSERLAEFGADGVVNPGEPVVLSGTETIVDTPRAIYPAGPAAAVYDVTGSPELRNASATVWIPANRSRFGDVDPTRARVARQHGGGWHLLETNTVSANATHVVVQARTPGISRFAVLPRNDLTFRWSIEGLGRIQAENVALRFDDPGIYAATLRVADGLGRENETTYRLLVNDRPDVRVVTPEEIEPGEQVTLRADVTDRYGETTVTWRFEDGQVVQGRTVNRSFEGGEHVVWVRVTDEFGESTTVEEHLVAGGRNPVVRVVEFALGLEGRLALLALASLVVVGIVRWLVDRAGGDRGRTRR